MRLRVRLAEQLRARLTEHLPLAGGASWDHGDVICVIEHLQVEHASAIAQHWQHAAELKGLLRAELHNDGLEDRAVEPLIANLLEDVLMLVPDENTAIGDLSEKARAILTEWHEEIRDTQRCSLLRFSVSGSLLRKVAAHDRPALHASQSPAIGSAHRDDYFEVGRHE